MNFYTKKANFQLLTVILQMTVTFVQGSRHTYYCAFYNESENGEEGIIENCGSKAVPEIQGHCYTLFEYDSRNRTSKVKLKGCFYNNRACNQESNCDRRNAGSTGIELYYCCCDGNMCNRDLTFEPQEVIPEEIAYQKRSVAIAPREIRQIISLVVAVIGCSFFLGTLFFGYLRHQRRIKVKNNACISDMECGSSGWKIKQPPAVNFLQMIAVGRFGVVRHARDNDSQDLAIKIFPPQSRDYWYNEYMIHKIPGFQHDTILELVGAYRATNKKFEPEFWLISNYQPRRSLRDYLTENVLTYDETLKILQSIVRGITHLHHSPTSGNSFKPIIAHRDLTSKNILLRTDMNACISDFGQAVVFRPGEPCDLNIRGRVGTQRYMAPEVLQGAIAFNESSFLRIDIYALGLIMWEIVSCCMAQDEPIGRYQLPFEDLVGLNPTFDQMYKIVFEGGQRPVMPKTWKNHAGLSLIHDTIEECWDNDPEARLAAFTVLDRIIRLVLLRELQGEVY